MTTPTAEIFTQALKDSLEYCEEADDRGSVSWEMARWQAWVATWEPILNEDGSL